jgi:tRNA threonylcarbamoyladenosine biosynthesis protein TsaE
MSAAAGAGQPPANGEPRADRQLLVATADQMRSLGVRLAGLLRAGDLVVLSGPLGAGKTTLAQGIGAGLRVRGQVTSPTFVIARLHPSLSGGPDLVHADAYRLGSRAEVDDLDLDADLATSVTVVEWGEGLVEDLAASFLAIGIEAVGLGRTHGEAAGPASDVKASGMAPDRAAEALADEGDQPRTVRLRGVGDRWRNGAAEALAALAITS